MRDDRPGEVTQLLMQSSRGDREALDRLMPLVYDELRLIAARHLSHERPGHTLQSTALVNEAYLRLVDNSGGWQDRTHFFAVAARIIRNILVDHARARVAAKRGGVKLALSLNDAIQVPSGREFHLISIDDALTSLTKLDEQQGRIVELRFFAGLSIEETSDVLKISPATVKRDWVLAKTWILRELTGPQFKAESNA